MSSIGSPSPFFLAGKKAYEIERSLRFDRTSSTSLERTPSSASNRRTFTFSCWFKLGNIASSHTNDYQIFGGTSGSVNDGLWISGSDTLFIYFDGATRRTTNQLIRDPSAWYHVVFAIDTTQSTASNRIKLYLNGLEITSFSTNTDPSLNYDSGVNNTTKQNIGERIDDSYFDGYMAEINLIDGFQYDPSYFGETDAITGQWNPKKYTGSYGTNGFYLNFSDNSGTTATTLGKDSSGNGNNFTPNNFSVAAGAGNDSLQDTPTNNFCTLNAIALGQGNEQRATLSNGNLDFTESSSSNRTAVSTFGLKTGKWYFEFLSTNTGTFSIGWHDMENNQGSFYRNNGSYSSSFGGGGTSGYASWTTNDIVGVAIDFDSGKIWYAKNNTWQSGDPATGNSPTNTFTTGRTLFTEAFTDNSSGTKSGSFNFGQRAFSYTPPTGYKSICSKNLPNPTINFPDKHFDTVVYTGDGNSTGSQTVLEFQPDWLWTKVRTAAYVHLLYDSLRGAGNSKSLNLAGGYTGTGTEGSAADNASYGFLNSFDANGFSYTKGALSTNYFNQSGQNYVVWNWNAGNTDGKTYTVKVHNFSGNNRYIFDDFQTEAVTLDLAEGGTYIFNMDDASNASHPFMIGTTANDNTTAFGSGIVYKLDGVVKTFAQYHAGFAAATTRRLEFTIPASTNNLFYFCYVHSGMGGQINTNSTLGSSNFDGSIQSTVKANTTAGFSIGLFTGTGANATIGHGLGAVPALVIAKSKTHADNWFIYHKSLGANAYIMLNSSSAADTSNSTVWQNVSPTSSVFYASTGGYNDSGQTLVFYAFSEVAGYSKFGTYTGNGSTDGTFVFTGFRPSVIILKRTNSAASWVIHDNKRAGYNGDNDYLHPDLLQAESDGSTGTLDILSNGFKLRMTAGTHNGSTDTYIYWCFAESPFKNARAR